MKKPAVAFTIVDDNYYYTIGTPLFINSFKRFHPDIPLVVYRQDMVDKIFKEKNINFYQAKPTFAKLLCDEYELVVNIDADTVFFGRMTEVFDKPYEVGGAWNKNDYEDATLPGITADMYVQAGLVASRNPLFWDIWEEQNAFAMKFMRKENDILNLVWYQNELVNKMDRVIFDKDKDYYGCKSLGREPEFTVHSSKLWCRDEQVVAYHWAKGTTFPKLLFRQDFNPLGFKPEVIDWIKRLEYGQTVTIL